MVDLRASYTAADTVPLKLFLNEGVKDLRPIHVQWIPTNRCNLNCSFCSCSERNKSLEMPLNKAISVIQELAYLGCKAVTITGGGEPLCHKGLTVMLEAFHQNNIQVGLVTNGRLLNDLSIYTLNKLTWCRISHGDERHFDLDYQQILSYATQATKVDWSFSYVVGSSPNLLNLVQVVDYANRKNFTHVRLVGDLLHPEEIDFEPIHRVLEGKDSKVIYQPRKEYTRGKDCLIGYVKPLIAPNFNVYMCCGVQYALEPMTKDLPDELCLGSALNLRDIYSNPSPQKVSCVRCYYQNYNELLKTLSRLDSIAHRDFI